MRFNEYVNDVEKILTMKFNEYVNEIKSFMRSAKVLNLWLIR